MKLSKAEQETIINWSADSDIASIYTTDTFMRAKLKKLALKYPVLTVVSETEFYDEYTCPTNIIHLFKTPHRTGFTKLVGHSEEGTNDTDV